MHTAELNINETDIEAKIDMDMGQYNQQLEPDTVFIGLRYLNGDPRNSNYADIEDYFEASFHVQNMVGDIESLKIGVGIKVNYNSIPGDKAFYTVPLGMNIEYGLPTQDFIPMYLAADVYYAPEVLSFGDAKNYFDYRVNFDVEIIEQARITIGWREIHTDYNERKIRHNQSAYAGIKFRF